MLSDDDDDDDDDGGDEIDKDPETTLASVTKRHSNDVLKSHADTLVDCHLQRSDDRTNIPSTDQDQDILPPLQGSVSVEESFVSDNPSKEKVLSRNSLDGKRTIHSPANNEESHSSSDQHVEGASSSCIASHKNPFAQFAAHNGAEKGSTSKRTIDLSQWIAPEKKKTKTKEKASCNKTTKWVRMRELSTDEQNRIVQKWHSLIDPKASLEDGRFQMLVAARLHARCQEGPVRQAMQNLQARLVRSPSSLPGQPGQPPLRTLSVQLLAQTNPDDWMDAVKNLQYYPTKARHIHKAANEIMEHFQGQVPECEEDLQKLTGIGPVLADLLAFVNTREVHQSRRRLREEEEEEEKVSVLENWLLLLLFWDGDGDQSCRQSTSIMASLFVYQSMAGKTFILAFPNFQCCFHHQNVCIQ